MNGNDARTADQPPLPPLPHEDPSAPSLIVEELIEDRKDDLRHALQERRAQLDARTLAGSADGIARQALDLIASLGLAEGDTVAAYVSRRHEPGMLPTLDLLHQAGLVVLLPVLGPALDRRWARYRGADDLAQRAPGRPLEPQGEILEACALGQARLVLVPALAVDTTGIRLGLGGGWYDRALLHAAPDAAVMAVVYDEEPQQAELPRAPHDIPVRGVLTPTSWWRLDLARSA